MSDHDHDASTVGRAILDHCTDSPRPNTPQRQSGVLTPEQIARHLAALADDMDTLAIQIGYHPDQPWADFRNELASAAHVVRRRSQQIDFRSRIEP